MKEARRIDALEAQLADHRERWLVTGGAGFIGSHVVGRLLALGQEVVVLDDLSTGSRANLAAALQGAGGSGELRFFEGDIRDRACLDAALEGADRVLHQAALGSVPRSIDNPVSGHEVNVNGFLALLEGCREAGVVRLVFASSSSVLGDRAPLPTPDDAPLDPVSPYAATKAANELMARAWWRAYGLPVVGLRYFNVCGPRQRVSGRYVGVVPQWVGDLASGRRPVLNGDDRIARDFCPVANVVEANLLAAFAPDDALGRVFNVGLGRQTTLSELYRAVRARVAASGVPCAGVEAERKGFRAGDIRRTQADLTGIREALGYSPGVGLDEGLDEAVSWALSALS